MHPDSSPDYDSSSSCPASPGGDTPDASSSSSMDSITKDPDTSTPAPPDSFVPTVTAISTSPDLKWMVQPTVLLTSVSPSLLLLDQHAKPKAHHSTVKTSPAAAAGTNNKAQSTSRKGQKEQPPKVDDEKRRIRRERNKIAAAKCRNRRRELTDTLQAETDELEEEREALQSEIEELLKEKERLEQILAAHTPVCKLANEEEGDEEDDVSAMLQDPPASPQLLSMSEDSSSPESNATIMAPHADVSDTVVPCIPPAAILGNSDILLCSSGAEEETLADLRGDDLDDLVPSLEMAVAPDTAAAVPDIDLLGGPFCLSDWETLYKSVANDLESLSSPSPVMMSSSPTCSSYRTVFSFNHSEFDDSMAEGGCCEGLKGPGLSPPDIMKDSLNSPTLLAL